MPLAGRLSVGLKEGYGDGKALFSVLSVQIFLRMSEEGCPLQLLSKRYCVAIP
jgi:hypothetical protein